MPEFENMIAEKIITDGFTLAAFGLMKAKDLEMKLKYKLGERHSVHESNYSGRSRQIK